MVLRKYEKIKLTIFFGVVVVMVYLIYLTTDSNKQWHFSYKVGSNMSMGSPVNKSVLLMDCQKKTDYLETKFNSTYKLIHGRMNNHCPIKEILRTLHSKSTSDEEFSKTVLSLGECHCLYYPRVPKCASRTVTTIFRQLARKHHFRLPSVVPVFDFGNPAVEHEYITNVSKEAKPFLFSRQVHYINFTRYQLPTPVQIGVIRDPVARLTSSYYYRIHGSNNQNPSFHSDSVNPICLNKTLDETVAEMEDSLSTEISSTLHPCWARSSSQLIFFCDCLPACQKPNKYRLQQAMRALESDFLLVGMTENIPEYMEALGLLLPHFFKGARDIFETQGLVLGEQTKTRKKSRVNPVTHGKLRKILADDYTFYYFAKQRFQSILKRLKHSQSFIRQMIDNQL